MIGSAAAMIEITRAQALNIIKLLAAIESWAMTNGGAFHDYLHDDLSQTVALLSTRLIGDDVGQKTTDCAGAK